MYVWLFCYELNTHDRKMLLYAGMYIQNVLKDKSLVMKFGSQISLLVMAGDKYLIHGITYPLKILQKSC